MARNIIKFGQVSENRKARFNYSIEDTIEAGISLTGAEIKSIRYGLVTIVDGFVQRRGDNLFLAGVEIQKLPTAARIVNFDERRSRQLLLHRNQQSDISLYIYTGTYSDRYVPDRPTP